MDTSALAQLFPRPQRGELKHTMLIVFDLHAGQRARLDLLWGTSDQARARITQWVQDL